MRGTASASCRWATVRRGGIGPLPAYIDLDDHFEKLEQVALSPADSLFMLRQALDGP